MNSWAPEQRDVGDDFLMNLGIAKGHSSHPRSPVPASMSVISVRARMVEAFFKNPKSRTLYDLL